MTREKTDFIVIGSGLAGITSALTLSDYGEVLMVTKGKREECATDLAQGGIAAVQDPSDTKVSHIQDTMRAGSNHNSPSAVEYLVNHAPQAIEWLTVQGVQFDRNTDGSRAVGQEAAHSNPRIVHATDYTGRQIERALLKAVQRKKNVRVWEQSVAVKLLQEKNRCIGVHVWTGKRNVACRAHAVILATGGLGGVYQYTTNPLGATGDGIALAIQAGARVRDLEFIQFHPTALQTDESPLFLLSEALRGEGAIIVNERGGRFLFRYDKREELAPRDIVARGVFWEQKNNPVYLDIRHKGQRFLMKRFPNIYREVKRRGYDLARDRVPITPAAHYACGGVVTDVYGRTGVPGLFAFGEVACTGVHGANRLASNSLLEAVVFPLRLREIMSTQQNSRVKNDAIDCIEQMCTPKGKNKKCAEIQKDLKKLMWENVGIIRTKQGLTRAKNAIAAWEKELERERINSLTVWSLRNQLLVAREITAAALTRSESLGAHWVTP